MEIDTRMFFVILGIFSVFFIVILFLHIVLSTYNNRLENNILKTEKLIRELRIEIKRNDLLIKKFEDGR